MIEKIFGHSKNIRIDRELFKTLTLQVVTILSLIGMLVFVNLYNSQSLRELNLEHSHASTKMIEISDFKALTLNLIIGFIELSIADHSVILDRLSELEKLEAQFTESISSIKKSISGDKDEMGNVSNIESLTVSLIKLGKKMVVTKLEGNDSLFLTQRAQLNIQGSELNVKIEKYSEKLLRTTLRGIEVKSSKRRAKLTEVSYFTYLIGFLLFLANIILSFRFKNSLKHHLSLATRSLKARSRELINFGERFISSNSELTQSSMMQHESSGEILNSSDISHETSKQTLELCKTGISLSHECHKKLELSNNSLSHLNDSINDIKDKSQELSGLVETIQEINSKTEVINSIVSKTQLLSFNASIEAARAGQYGKGFAVVAEEVGKLATLSGEASKDINKLLNSSMSYIHSTVDSMNKSIETGERESKVFSENYQEVQDEINHLRVAIENISEKAEQQITNMRSTKDLIQKVEHSPIYKWP